jgi:prepilin-type processing-associated H-X9-DG protein
MIVASSSYTFDASARTVTISGLPSLTIEGFKLITNLTDGVIIYQFNAPLKGGALAANVLTLDYDTTAMDDADDLMVIYEQPGSGEQTIRIDEVTTYTYLGYSTPGASAASAVWRIKRMTNASGNVLFADGDEAFDNIWDNRASLTYS